MNNIAGSRRLSRCKISIGPILQDHVFRPGNTDRILQEVNAIFSLSCYFHTSGKLDNMRFFSCRAMVAKLEAGKLGQTGFEAGIDVNPASEREWFGAIYAVQVASSAFARFLVIKPI